MHSSHPKLKVHQALHGYREGHQLLSISDELSREQLGQLRVMSDLSGPAFRAQFDTYVTAYPLHGAQVYALARTWYAREMPRPGCVWTHTLLVGVADFALVPDLSDLNKLFRRPAGPDDAADYAEPLTVHVGSDVAEHGTPHGREFLGSTLAALYGMSAPVVLVATNSTEHENLVWRIWSQQWPALRKVFSFSTGCLSIKGESLDLLVVPPEVSRQARDSDGFSVVDPMALTPLASAWVAEVSDDLFHGGGSLREFLWRFGPALAPTRQSFHVLSEVYASRKHWSRGADAVNHTISSLAMVAGGTLSTPLLEWLFAGSPREDPSEQRSIVRALLAHPNADQIPASIAKLDEIASQIADQGEAQALELAREASGCPTTHARAFLLGIGAWYSGSPQRLKSVPIDVLVELLKRSPSLALHVETWERTEEQQRLLANNLDLDWARANLRGLVATVGIARAFAGMDSLALRTGREVIGAVLASVDANELSPDADLARCLATHVAFVVAELASGTLGPRGLWFGAAIPDPRNWYSSLNAHAFVGLSIEQVGTGDSVLDARTCACIFALARKSNTKDTLPLFAQTLPFLYRAAAENRLPDSAWERLEAFLPWTFPEWDKCARLVRAVLDKMLDTWAVHDFFFVFRDEELFARAVSELVWFWSGKKFRRHLRKAVEHGEVTATREQLSALGVGDDD